MFDWSWETYKQVMKCGQHSANHSSKLRFCIPQRNQAPPLPTPENKGLPRFRIGLLTHHHELSPLIIFNDKSFYVHICATFLVQRPSCRHLRMLSSRLLPQPPTGTENGSRSLICFCSLLINAQSNVPSNRSVACQKTARRPIGETLRER